jgi:hypothetical protein
MVSNSTNINKTNNHLSHSLSANKKGPGPGWGQAQNYVGAKLDLQ